MESSTDSRRAAVVSDLGALVTPPRRMPTRNRPTARATGSLNSSPITTPGIGRPRGPSKRRCVSTGSAVVNQPLLPDLHSSPPPADGNGRKPKGSTGGAFPTDTHIAEDGILSVAEEPPAYRRIPAATQSAPEVPLARRRENSNDTATSRPKLRAKSKSSPLPGAELTSAELDDMIIYWLEYPLTKKQHTSQKVGNNYLFEAIVAEGDGRKVMKIGVTKGSKSRRLKTIDTECQHFRMEEQDDPKHMPIRLYHRAEKLIHAELLNFQYSFNCHCKRQSIHREYFDVSKADALEVIQRWREFCRKEPYDDKGELKSFWRDRLKYLKSYGESGTDHRRRGERWKRFLNPGFLATSWYDFRDAFTKFWKLRWRIIAFVESFIIVTLTFPCFSAILFFAFLSTWIIIEMINLEQPVTWGLFGWKPDGLGTTPLSRALSAEFESVPRGLKPPSITIKDEAGSTGGFDGEESSFLGDESLYEEEAESPDTSLLEDAVSEMSEQADAFSVRCDAGT